MVTPASVQLEGWCSFVMFVLGTFCHVPPPPPPPLQRFLYLSACFILLLGLSVPRTNVSFTLPSTKIPRLLTSELAISVEVHSFITISLFLSALFIVSAAGLLHPRSILSMVELASTSNWICLADASLAPSLSILFHNSEK